MKPEKEDLFGGGQKGKPQPEVMMASSTVEELKLDQKQESCNVVDDDRPIGIQVQLDLDKKVEIKFG